MIGRFLDGGRRYVVQTPVTPHAWKNYLFNDEYITEATQTLQGCSMSFIQYHAETWGKGFRYFYLRNHEDGQVFCPLYAPLKSALDSYKCEYGLGYSLVRSVCRGLQVEIRVFVPTEGKKEIWTVAIKNETDRAQTLSLFSAFNMDGLGTLGTEGRIVRDEALVYRHCFPYHARFEEREEHFHDLQYVYLHSGLPAVSYEADFNNFFGCDDPSELPKAVKEGACGNGSCEGQCPIGAMEHRMSLAPGEKQTIPFVFGAAASLAEIRQEMTAEYEMEFQAVSEQWSRRCENWRICSGAEDLDALVNFWLKKQVTYLTRLNRLTAHCPVRNQLQDAMGYSMVEPQEAFRYAMDVLRRQRTDGSIKQWYHVNGLPDQGLSSLEHSDGPVWLILCITAIIDHCKDPHLYDIIVPYQNGDRKESVLAHLKRAAFYMGAQVGAHGLCLMKDGDWTDPINGMGREGRGESTWNTLALIYAVERLLELDPDSKLVEMKERLSVQVNRYCWDGRWYLLGFDDGGSPVGTKRDQEGRLFLNAQTWALIAGVVPPEREEALLESIASLHTVCGYRLLAPPLTHWDARWGKLSIKRPGTTENGSVYCHASAFKAFADWIRGDREAAKAALLELLPTNPHNPPEQNRQLPLYVPNYYFGLETENFGRSSGMYQTGTAAWILYTVEKLFR